MKKIIRSLMLAAVAMLTLSGCEHKELCYHHPHGANVRIQFDWRDAPDASVEGMAVFFYPLAYVDPDDPDGGRGDQDDVILQPLAPCYRVDITGMEGGVLRGVPNGKYRVVCYNNDTDGVLFNYVNAYDKHHGFTRDGSPLEPLYGAAANRAPMAEGSEGQRVVITPDQMWGCSVADVEVHDSGITYICVPETDKEEWMELPVTNDEWVITLFPHELTCTYTYEYRNVENLEYAIQHCATLSGMASSLQFYDEALGEEPVIVPFEAISDRVSKITGKFYVWGHHPEQTDTKHMMTLYIWVRNKAEGLYYTNDVTDQVNNAPDKRHVHIIIDNIKLPEAIAEGDSPMTPSIDDWLVENYDVPM